MKALLASQDVFEQESAGNMGHVDSLNGWLCQKVVLVAKADSAWIGEIEREIVKVGRPAEGAFGVSDDLERRPVMLCFFLGCGLTDREKHY